MNDTKQANPRIAEDTGTIKTAFLSKLDELIVQHDDSTNWVGSVGTTKNPKSRSAPLLVFPMLGMTAQVQEIRRTSFSEQFS